MGKVIAVVSGKGGTGKTTTVGAVASCLAVLGHKTLCLDLDAGLKNLDITLGMSDYAVSDFCDVIENEASLDSACSQHPDIENLYFLSAPADRLPADISFEDMRQLADMIRENFDFCFIDAPAGIGPGFALAASVSDSALIIVTGDVSSIRDAQRAAQELSALGVGEIRLLVNRVTKKGFRLMHSTIDDMIDTVGAQLIGVVREDPSVSHAANAEKPLVLYTYRGAAREFLRIARRICGTAVPIPYK